ncbi:bark storage protein A-like isoform X3 [Coffea eugenioides]|uniref:bark storage protein A-like isoform X3 n=1 Tax=Coffea eugenioides TaxID=49369 RepID=UPI000F60CCFE|nr:bark storage protein A-like isoform X3 [Coffea eugenioides]XP_027163648.1 bark storage protein A-like isoform X3 [Coffea eugenioides]
MAAKQVTERGLVMIDLASALLCCLSLSALLSSAEKLESSLTILKEVNLRGPYLGLITVYPPEEDAFFDTGAFKPHQKHPYVDLSGRRFRVGKMGKKKVIYVRCGVGMVNAAAATQQMLDMFDKPNATIPAGDFTELDFGAYSEPSRGYNQLGSIGYSTEQFFSKWGKPNTAQRKLWFHVSKNWLELANTRLEGMVLEQCVNSSSCLTQRPKLVVGLSGATADIFLDNAAYGEFLYKTFQVSSVDMESVAVVMTSLSNGFPVIVIRGLSDQAGAQEGQNPIDLFGPLAASNAAKAVVQFVKAL